MIVQKDASRGTDLDDMELELDELEGELEEEVRSLCEKTRLDALTLRVWHECR